MPPAFRVAALAILFAASATGASLACGSFQESTDPPPPGAGDAEAGTDVPPLADAEADAAVSDAEAGDAEAGDAGAALVVTAPGLAAFAAGPAGLTWSIGNALYGLLPGAAPTLMYTDTDAITSFIVVSASDVFVSKPISGTVVRCPLGVACTPASVVNSTIDAPGPLALSAQKLFIAEQQGLRRLLSCTATACGGDLGAFAPPSLPDSPALVAASAAHALVSLTNGAVISYPAGGAALTLKAPGPVGGIANDGVNAYWIDSGTNRIGVRAFSGLPAASSSFTLAGGRDLVLDGGHLYWLEATTFSVRRCALPGCATAELVTTLAGTTRMALGDRIYLANDSTGKIYAVPRP
jgi:hypothetical protein